MPFCCSMTKTISDASDTCDCAGNNKGGSYWKYEDDVLLRYFQPLWKLHNIKLGVSKYIFVLTSIVAISSHQSGFLSNDTQHIPPDWLWKSRILAGMSQSPPFKRQRTSSTTTTTSFAIEPISQFAGTSAIIKQPVELTCFSYDKHRNLHHDTSSMVPSPSIYTDQSRNTITQRS